MFIENRENELVYMTSSVIGTRHAFTTRYGGVSEGIFSSLNLGSNRGDDPAAVRENYRRVCALMGVGVDGAVVTNLPLLCFTADCVPALLCDSVHGVAAAVHCGWRSSVGDILGNAVAAMTALGARPESICCALGPAIGSCCFETDDDVPAAIETWLQGDTAGLFRRRGDGKTLVDLRLANARRLLQLGLSQANVDISDECTYCSHDKYWSHRYTKGQRGSQAAAIVLR